MSKVYRYGGTPPAAVALNVIVLPAGIFVGKGVGVVIAAENELELLLTVLFAVALFDVLFPLEIC